MSTVNELCAAAHKNALEHGFVEATFGERLALIHSEVSEALEDYRAGHPIWDWWFGPEGKPEGVPVELADVLIRVFDLAGAYDVDLETALEAKMKYNETRPYRHGGKVL